jgi:ABC-2 type transport system ATP-binding protein
MIELEDLCQEYRGREVIHGLSLSLGPGAYGLLGPNGAGKSTLLRALATITRPAGGTLRLFGAEVRSGRELRTARRRVGYLPQAFAYPADFSVTDFVRHCAWLREVPRKDIPEAAREAIARVDLTADSQTALKRLSGGMLRRAGIAQAIAGRPGIVILDEPTTGLDPHQRVRFRELIRDLATESCVILSTHLLEDLVHTCARIGVLHEGLLKFDGSLAGLEAKGAPEHLGDTPLERGYAAILAGDGSPETERAR